ncbi:unnamed protein product [Microthlaspi erraticum]|uniref:Reverse transcriptase zinc-binding domain-containing protein n=1 Tax=Microthlaspi erraticum TaxID=1685480 RepID=A0A6D2J703_9BRAS|nr:unnamed protein product [Microthlaspi erraticum]
MTEFWWNACEEKRKIHWVSWKEMCKSKANGGLGFRDISDFNQSRLAKQAWRILNVPDSLLSRLYKGRYFQSTDFLSCGKDSRPSYTWRSILHGRELLSRGLMKSIGNGQDTNVWIDKWILDEAPRRPVNKQCLYDLCLKVSDLILPSGRWNGGLLRELFPPADVVRIENMDIGNVHDKNIWSYTKHGAYTVKSGYWFVANHPFVRPTPLSARDQFRIELKNRVWLVKSTPNIKMFLWRVLSGALAVSDRLRTRGIQIDLTCKLCRNDTESICHMLFTCDAAQQIFVQAQIPQPASGFSNSLEENFAFVLDLMEDHSLLAPTRQAIPWILWNIWKHRNAILLAGHQESPYTIAQRAKEEATIWFQVNTEIPVQTTTNCSLSASDNCWYPPLNGQVKCNLFANWRNRNLLSGGAWILRDHYGQVIFHARDAFTCSPNRLVAEFRCIIWAMTSLSDLHLPEVTIASDLADAVEAI